MRTFILYLKYKKKHYDSTSQYFYIATDLNFYDSQKKSSTVPNPTIKCEDCQRFSDEITSIDDIDYIECYCNRQFLERQKKCKVLEGYDLFCCRDKYLSDISELSEPSIVLLVGVYTNTNDMDKTKEQQELFDDNKLFVCAVLESLKYQFPDSMILFISTSEYTCYHDKLLSGSISKISVLSNKTIDENKKYGINNVRWGANDIDSRCLFGQQYCLIYGKFDHEILTYDEEKLDIYETLKKGINRGNILQLGSNRFQSSVQFYKYIIEHDNILDYGTQQEDNYITIYIKCTNRTTRRYDYITIKVKDFKDFMQKIEIIKRIDNSIDIKQSSLYHYYLTNKLGKENIILLYTNIKDIADKFQRIIENNQIHI